MHVIVEHCECGVLCFLFGKKSPDRQACDLRSDGGLSCPDACYRYRKPHGTGYAFILLCANLKYGKLTNASVTDKSKMLFCLKGKCTQK